MEARWSRLDGCVNGDIVDGALRPIRIRDCSPCLPHAARSTPHRTGASLDSWRLVIPQYELHSYLSCAPELSLQRTYMLGPQYVNLGISFSYTI